MAHVLGVHSADHCAPMPCPVHRPSNHHMREWPKDFKREWRIVTRVCPHGIQHPDPDDLDWLERMRRPTDLPRAHECDGCCGKAPAAKQASNLLVLEDNDSLALFLARWFSEQLGPGKTPTAVEAADALVQALRERSAPNAPQTKAS